MALEMMDTNDDLGSCLGMHIFGDWLEGFGTLLASAPDSSTPSRIQTHLDMWQIGYPDEKYAAFQLQHRYARRSNLSLHNLEDHDKAVCQRLALASNTKGFYLLLASSRGLVKEPAHQSICAGEVELDGIYSCDGNQVLNHMTLPGNVIYGTKYLIAQNENQNHNLFNGKNSPMQPRYHNTIALLIPKYHFTSLINVNNALGFEKNIIFMVLLDLEHNQSHQTIEASSETMSKVFGLTTRPTGIDEIIQYAMAQGEGDLRRALSQAISYSEFKDEFNRSMKSYVIDAIATSDPMVLQFLFDPVAELTTLETLESNLEIILNSVPLPCRDHLRLKAEEHLNAKILSQHCFNSSHFGFLVDLIWKRLDQERWLTLILIPTLSSRGEPDLLNNLDRVFSMVKSMELKKQVIHTPIAGNGYKRAAEAPPTVSKHDSRRRKVVFEAGP